MGHPVPGGEPAHGCKGRIAWLLPAAVAAVLLAPPLAGQTASPYSEEEARVLAICEERLRADPTHRYFFDKLLAIHRRHATLPELLRRYASADGAGSRLVHARLLVEQGCAREARAALESLLTQGKLADQAHLLLARLLARQADPAGALRHYRAVLAGNALRGREKIQLEAAGQAMRAGKTEEALALVAQIPAAHQREAFYLEHRMTAALVASLEQRWERTRYTAARLGLSAQLVALGGPQSARHAAYILEHTAPGHWTRRSLLELLRQPRSASLERALLPVCRAALGRRPAERELRLAVAQALAARGEHELAAALLRAGLDLEPGQADLRLALADLLIARGQLIEAEKLLLAAQGSAAPRLLLRRLRLALEAGRDGIAGIAGELATAPRATAGDLLEADDLLRRLGRGEDGRRLLQAAAGRWPHDHRPLLRLARAEWLAGRRDAAAGLARRVAAVPELQARRAGVRLLLHCGRQAEAFALLERWSAAAGGEIYLELAGELAREFGDRAREQGFLLARLRDVRTDLVPELALRIAALGAPPAAALQALAPERRDWLEAGRLLHAGRTDPALERMTALAQAGPPAHLLALARQARGLDRPAMARDAYSCYLQTAAGRADRQAALELSALKLASADWLELAQWFDGLLRRFPDEPQLYLLQADLALRDDDWPTALELLGRGLVACGEKPRLLLAAAQIEGSLGRRGQAAAFYRRLAAASEGELRRKAIAALLELPAPGAPADPISAEVLVRGHLRRGEQEQALAMIDSSVRRYPDRPQLLRLQGELQLAAGEGEQSTRLLRRVLLATRRPDPALARLLARALALSGQTAQARELIDRQPARGPLARARAYLACGLFGAAIEELEAIKKQEGGSSALEQMLLVAYLADGRGADGKPLAERQR